jgi:hypothetical protein
LNKIHHGSRLSFSAPKRPRARAGAVDIFLNCPDRGIH